MKVNRLSCVKFLLWSGPVVAKEASERNDYWVHHKQAVFEIKANWFFESQSWNRFLFFYDEEKWLTVESACKKKHLPGVFPALDVRQWLKAANALRTPHRQDKHARFFRGTESRVGALTQNGSRGIAELGKQGSHPSYQALIVMGLSASVQPNVPTLRLQLQMFICTHRKHSFRPNLSLSAMECWTFGSRLFFLPVHSIILWRAIAY